MSKRPRIASLSAVVMAALMAGVLAAPAALGAVPTCPGPNCERLAGPTRYDTAVNIARAKWAPSGGPLLAPSEVWVATGANFPDALAAGAAAGVAVAPLLLVRQNSIPTAVKNQLEDFATAGASRFYVVGGADVVSTGVENTLKALPGAPDVVRLSGTTRYGTAAKVYEEEACGFEVLLATGTNFPDAIAGGALAGSFNSVFPTFLGAGAILLANSSGVPQETINAMNNCSTDSVTFLGGTDVLPASLQTQIDNEVPTVTNFKRLEGVNRFETAVEIAKEFTLADVDKVYLAVGDNFPDALAGGPAAARDPFYYGSPILLSKKNCLPASVSTYINSLNGGAGPTDIVMLGGTDVLSDSAPATVC